MESSRYFILQHKETGLYISKAPESYHTKSLRQARRYIDQNQIDVWMQASCYAPEDPEQYETVPIIITIAREVKHE